MRVSHSSLWQLFCWNKLGVTILLSIFSTSANFSYSFKYEPQIVKSILFSDSKDTRPRKKLRVSPKVVEQMDADDDVSMRAAEDDNQSSIIIETSCEAFLITPLPISNDTADKENAESASTSGHKYIVALLPKTKAATPEEKPSMETPQETSGDQKETKAAPSIKPADPPVSASLPSESSDPSAAPPSTDTAAVTDDAPQVNGVKEKLLSLDLPLNETGKSPPGEADKDAKRASSSELNRESDMSISPASESRSTPVGQEEAATATPKTNGVVELPQDPVTPVQAASGGIKPLPEPTEAAEPVASSSTPDAPVPMDVSPPEKTEDDIPVQATDVQTVQAPEAEATPSQDVPAVQVLQRNLGEDDLVFDADGVSILVGEPENGTRKGWKIEATTWRWATEVPKFV